MWPTIIIVINKNGETHQLYKQWQIIIIYINDIIPKQVLILVKFLNSNMDNIGWNTILFECIQLT